ncbi:MAG: hypothetical protein LIO74_05040 [Ruminococcus sp.]|nr:hypothetical protein [Ruminococcus sp.]
MDSYLYHHGILGQKWGVRRYQNYDGSYTQRGLERYKKARSNYETAKDTLNSTKAAYKSGNATKESYTEAKVKTRKAKNSMNSAYRKLKTDKMADQGKQLYKSGKTITDNKKKLEISEGAIAIGGLVTGYLVNEKTGNMELAGVSAAAVSAGGTAVNALLGLKTNSENKKLRAYYAH